MKSRKGFTLVEMMIVFGIGLVVLIIPVLSMWTERNLDFWISHFKGHAVHVPFWLDVAITIIGNGFILAANLIAEICRYIVK